MGAETHFHLDTGAHRLVVRAGPDSSCEANAVFDLTFDGASLHFFDPTTELAIPL
jgi:hypothetical protein